MQKQHLSEFYHSLGVMLEAGVPILKAIRSSVSAAPVKYHQSLSRVEKNVHSGQGLSESMAALPIIFSRLDVSLIHVGETSGNLPEIFLKLSEWYDYQVRCQRRIRSALMLPSMIFVLAAFIGPLPLVFLKSITISQYFIQVIYSLAIPLIPMFLIVGMIKRASPNGIFRRILDFIAIIVPVLRRAVISQSLSRFFLTFHLLLKSGVPMLETIRLSRQLTSNYYVRQWFSGCESSVQKGNPVSDGFSSLFPREYRQLWIMGEETGDLDSICLKMYNQTSEDAEYYLKQFSDWLPKIIYLIILLYSVIQILRASGVLFTGMSPQNI